MRQVATQQTVRQLRPRKWLAVTAWLAPAVIIYFALCLWHLTRQDLVLDELTAIGSLRMPLGEMIPWRLGRGHPPLFFIILWGWVRLLGWHFYSLQALPILISALGIPLVYLIGRELGLGRWAGLAALLWVLHNVTIYYARMVRPYGGMMVMGLAVLWLLLVCLRRPTPGRLWALAGVGVLGAVWNHNVLLVWAGALGAAWLMRRRLRPPTGVWLAGAAALAAHTAMIGLTAWQAGGGEPLAWIEPLHFDQLADQTMDLLGGNITWYRHLDWTCLLPLALVGAMIFSANRGLDGPAEARWRLVLATALAPPALLLLISLFQPVYMQRYMLVALPGMILMLARMLRELRPRPAAWLLLALLLVQMPLAVEEMAQSRRTGLRKMAEELARRHEAGDGIMVFNDESALALMLFTPLDKFDYFIVPRRESLEEQRRLFEAGCAGRRRIWILGVRHRGGLLEPEHWDPRAGSFFLHQKSRESELWGLEPAGFGCR